jgi:hypothetical protein
LKRHVLKHKLAVIESETAVYVVIADDPDDWIACFTKLPDFPALKWAERMVFLHNHGLSSPVKKLVEKAVPD